MLISELPKKIQQELLAERSELCSKWYRNTPYEVCFTNPEGTRYFLARRKQIPYSDQRGNYMPYGGGSKWSLQYGKILWSDRIGPFGKEYFWKMSKKVFSKSANGTEIPSNVQTKKEVIEIAKNIGILVMNIIPSTLRGAT